MAAMRVQVNKILFLAARSSSVQRIMFLAARSEKYDSKAKGLFAELAFFHSLCGLCSFSATFTFKNNCPYTVWPGTLTNPGVPQFPSTGFELRNGASQSFNAPATWAGRFWARTGCTNGGKFTCATADYASGQIGCNGASAIPPASLVEMTLSGGASHNMDFYDISLVDGFNFPVGDTIK
ncbi:hypothetical protein IFM89_033309 [Coptis chinensis]|uniref:Thaumatin-like protein n=1 Tax=Coptis chinensis TaxID=261450 RepID=A0A835HGH5_9MAGN|nr:hypothetical protein IFM89_033309 [Coptis chinensis]